MGNKNNISQDTIGLLVHSYNNYLSGLMGFTELALLECEQDVVKERLDMSLESGSEAVIFGKQLLSSIGRLQVTLQPLVLKKLLEKLCDSNENLSADLSLLKQDIFINTEPNWFLYCLKSVIGFCIDYSNLQKLKPSTHLSVNQNSTTVSIVISCQITFSEEQEEQLFDLFYTSRVLMGNKDVGLSMVKGFVEQMKGHIQWQHGQGFVIQIPTAKS